MVVYCCKDLFFATKIRTAADDLGIVSRPARDADALARRLDRVPDGKPNRPVTGVIVDLELADEAFGLIERATDAENPRPQIVAFGSHVAADRLAAARDAGADFVMPRSSFTANLPAILQRLAHRDPPTPPHDPDAANRPPTP